MPGEVFPFGFVLSAAMNEPLDFSLFQTEGKGEEEGRTKYDRNFAGNFLYFFSLPW